jgi:hypothetical protein
MRWIYPNGKEASYIIGHSYLKDIDVKQISSNIHFDTDLAYPLLEASVS